MLFGGQVKATDCEDVHWSHLVQDRIQWQTVVSTVMNLRFPLKFNLETGRATIISLRTTSLHAVS